MNRVIIQYLHKPTVEEYLIYLTRIIKTVILKIPLNNAFQLAQIVVSDVYKATEMVGKSTQRDLYTFLGRYYKTLL